MVRNQNSVDALLHALQFEVNKFESERANHEARAFKEGNSSYDDKEIHVTQTQR